MSWMLTFCIMIYDWEKKHTKLYVGKGLINKQNTLKRKFFLHSLNENYLHKKKYVFVLSTNVLSEIIIIHLKRCLRDMSSSIIHAWNEHASLFSFDRSKYSLCLFYNYPTLFVLLQETAAFLGNDRQGERLFLLLV
jgi:hypothetical protein